MADRPRRIFHIAKELNISPLEIIKFLKLRDIEVKSHMAPVDSKIYDLTNLFYDISDDLQKIYLF